MLDARERVETGLYASSCKFDNRERVELELDVWDGVESELYVWQKEFELYTWLVRQKRQRPRPEGFPQCYVGVNSTKV